MAEADPEHGEQPECEAAKAHYARRCFPVTNHTGGRKGGSKSARCMFYDRFFGGGSTATAAQAARIPSKTRNRPDPAATEKLVRVSSNSQMVAAAGDADGLKMCAWDDAGVHAQPSVQQLAIMPRITAGPAAGQHAAPACWVTPAGGQAAGEARVARIAESRGAAP